MSRNFSIEAFYTWADATDNAFQSSLISDVQIVRGAGTLGANGPTDSFIGVPPLVLDPKTGQSNEHGAVICEQRQPCTAGWEIL
jgi:hypothetical protein